MLSTNVINGVEERTNRIQTNFSPHLGGVISRWHASIRCGVWTTKVKIKSEINRDLIKLEGETLSVLVCHTYFLGGLTISFFLLKNKHRWDGWVQISSFCNLFQQQNPQRCQVKSEVVVYHCVSHTSSSMAIIIKPWAWPSVTAQWGDRHSITTLSGMEHKTLWPGHLPFISQSPLGERKKNSVLLTIDSKLDWSLTILS